MSDGPEVNVNLVNYPPTGDEISIRQVAFGAVGPMQLLLQMEYDDDTEEVNVSITLSNMAEHTQIKEALSDIISLLETVRDGAQPEIDAEIERMENT